MLKLIPVEDIKKIKVNKESRLGTMRIDWVSDHISNQWFPTQEFESLCKENNVSIPTLQEEINQIMFDQLKDFETVLLLIARTEVIDDELTFKVEGKQVTYYIKLIYQRDNYSSIMVYLKE